MAQVVIENLSKHFTGPKGEDIRAVQDLSLTVQDKEFLVLVGPSGCGKTTTLRLIAGLEEPASGAISIDGKDMTRISAKDRGVAMVFQNPALYPHMTVHENLAFGLKLRRCPKAELESRVLSAAELLEVTDCLTRRPEELSGGQRQRVALARAIVQQAKILLLDEPLSNLDPQLRLQMRTELRRLHARIACTMIYVTHDQTEAMTMGDRIAVIKEGSIQQIADPVTLYQHPENTFVASFIGSPPMNFFKGRLLQNNGALFFREETISPANLGAPASLPASAPRPQASMAGITSHPLVLKIAETMADHLGDYFAKPILLGIRPEHILPHGIANGEDSEQTVEAVVEVVERLGWETLLYLRCREHPLTARIHAAEQISPNQKLQLAIQMEKAHFFDPVTEKRIA